MTPHEARYLAKYKPNSPESETDELCCAYCCEWSPLFNWTIEPEYCETCGGYNAMCCPECEETNGSVHTHDDAIQVRKAET